MELSEKFIQSQYSIEELEQFRDENGFIDLSAAGIRITPESREIVGNPNRVKNWVDFNGRKVLIKGEIILDEEKNYGIYAELIVEEIAKQSGQKNAHYDLMKMKNENGEDIFGVMSESIVDIEKGEQLVSLHDIIGDQPEGESDFIDTVGYEFTVNTLREKLALDGYDEEQIEKVINDYRKRLAFTLSVIETDKHIENIAFIKRKVEGRDEIELSPNIDSEAALMLDNDITTIKKLIDNYYALKESVNIAHPRIGTLRSIEEGGFNSLWIDSLEELCEEDDIYDYCDEVLREKVDMDIVIENVEKRINAKLPESVKLIVKYAYICRNEEMMKVVDGEMEQEYEDDSIDTDFMLNTLINMGINKKIRTDEQMTIGKTLEKEKSFDRRNDDKGQIFEERI